MICIATGGKGRSIGEVCFYPTLRDDFFVVVQSAVGSRLGFVKTIRVLAVGTTFIYHPYHQHALLSVWPIELFLSVVLATCGLSSPDQG